MNKPCESGATALRGKVGYGVQGIPPPQKVIPMENKKEIRKLLMRTYELYLAGYSIKAELEELIELVD